MNEIKNRVLKTELVEWRKLVELQPKNFKELSKINYEKLKQSILKENFVMSFTVWQSKDTIYIIDGHHRYKVLDLLEKEGISVPEKLPCTFIECRDKKEASKLVLTYSSIYARINEEYLYEFLNINDFDFESIKSEIDIPGINLNAFEVGYVNELNEWQGLTDFQAADNVLKIVINFENKDEREKFAKDHKLDFMKKETMCWTTWFPFKERRDLKSVKYE